MLAGGWRYTIHILPLLRQGKLSVFGSFCVESVYFSYILGADPDNSILGLFCGVSVMTRENGCKAAGFNDKVDDGIDTITVFDLGEDKRAFAAHLFGVPLHNP